MILPLVDARGSHTTWYPGVLRGASKNVKILSKDRSVDYFQENMLLSESVGVFFL